jgi:hypothetical protein
VDAAGGGGGAWATTAATADDDQGDACPGSESGRIEMYDKNGHAVDDAFYVIAN